MTEWLNSSKITLRTARILSGYTLKEAAASAGISASVLGRYEKNPSNIYASMATKIVRIYGVTIDDLDFGTCV